MKWKNKGHEFDEVFDNIKKCSDFYLFGAGHDGAMIYDILCTRYNEIKIIGFIDNDPSKQGKLYKGLPVYALEEITCTSNTGIIISFSSELTLEINQQLQHHGWSLHQNFWHYEEFVPVVAAYAYAEWFIPSISFIPSTACNLRCESCLNFTTYCKHFETRSLEDVIEDVDLFFEKVDYIGLFYVSGGEPLLYPYIADLLKYIAKKYKHKIYSLERVTNGTVAPNQEFLTVLRDCDIKITVDDYRESLPQYIEQIDSNISLLLDFGGEEKVIPKVYDTWIDLYPHPQKETTAAELVTKYDRCHVPWQEYYCGRLYTCNYASFAAKAGIIDPIDDSETYDLSAHTQEKIKQAMEFRLGYSEKGYADFCKKCAGYIEINPYQVKPAIQKKEE